MRKILLSLAILAFFLVSAFLCHCPPTGPGYVSVQFLNSSSNENLFLRGNYNSDDIELIRVSDGELLEVNFVVNADSTYAYLMINEFDLGNHTYKISAAADLEVFLSFRTYEPDLKGCISYKTSEFYVLDYSSSLVDETINLYNVFVN